MKKAYLIILLGAMNAIYSLSKLIDSFQKVDQEWATKYSFNQDYIIWFLSSLMVIGIGYIIYKEDKK